MIDILLNPSVLQQAQEEYLFKADTKDCTKRPLNKTQMSAKLNKVIMHNLRLIEAGSKLVTVPE